MCILVIVSLFWKPILEYSFLIDNIQLRQDPEKIHHLHLTSCILHSLAEPMSESLSKQPDLSKLNLDSADKLSRIHDLIFGQQSRDYDQKIERHRQELTRISNDVNRLSELVRTLESSFNAQLKTLTEQLSERIEEQGKRQTQLLNELAQQINQQLQTMERQQQQMLALEEAMRQSEESMMQELRTTATRLHKIEKADREN